MIKPLFTTISGFIVLRCHNEAKTRGQSLKRIFNLQAAVTIWKVRTVAKCFSWKKARVQMHYAYQLEAGRAKTFEPQADRS